MLYFDHNATSPPRPEVLEVVHRTARDLHGNPSSQHSSGRRARALLEESRECLASLLGVGPTEIVFTSGGTEANRLAIEGALEGAGGGAPPHVAVSAMEHPSVLEVLARGEERGRLRLTRIGGDPAGRIAIPALEAALLPATRLVSVQHSNSETGVLQPLREALDVIARAGAVERRPAPLLHVDAVQSLGKVPLRPAALGADLMTFSAHKIGGPMGCGALWARRGAGFEPHLRGGPQERGIRPGTENLPAIAGFALALEIAIREQGEEPSGGALGPHLRKLLLERVEGVSVNGDPAHALPNTVNASFEDVPSDLLVIRLDREGVAVSTGSACSSGSREPSHVLRAMGLPPGRVKSAVRFSTGWTTRTSDVESLVEAVRIAVTDIRRARARAV